MNQPTNVSRGRDGFPDAPIPGSPLLVPITCWAGMVCEIRITNVVIDSFWIESIKDGVCYFFRWLGHPRSTVLVVYGADDIAKIECRTLGDCPVSFTEAQYAVLEVLRLFKLSGYKTHLPLIDTSIYPSDDEGPSPHELWSHFIDEMCRRDETNDKGIEFEPRLMIREHPEFSKFDDVYTAPMLELRRERGLAKRAGFFSEDIDLMFPWLKLRQECPMSYRLNINDPLDPSYLR